MDTIIENKDLHNYLECTQINPGSRKTVIAVYRTANSILLGPYFTDDIEFCNCFIRRFQSSVFHSSNKLRRTRIDVKLISMTSRYLKDLGQDCVIEIRKDNTSSRHTVICLPDCHRYANL
jgi:hypothetical protein